MPCGIRDTGIRDSGIIDPVVSEGSERSDVFMAGIATVDMPDSTTPSPA